MSDIIDKTLKHAYTMARQRRHELVTLEHLLAAMLCTEEIQDICVGVGGSLEKLAHVIDEYIEDPSNNIIVPNANYTPKLTNTLMNTIKKAKTQSLFSSRTEINLVDLFIAMFNIENCPASFFLHSAGIDKDAVIEFLKNKNKKADNQASKKDALEILNQFCVNLNEKAKQGKIDPLIGREEEVETITQVMARRNKHNVVMIGDPGVGKTIVVEGLAKRISEGSVPETLMNKTIYSLDLAALVAGTKFRGDFEERVKAIVAAFSSLPDTIMFIDEIHMIMGAGSGNSGSMDAANLLKPALGRGEIRCIGSTTAEEYRKYFEKDRAMMRRFQRLDINEPSADDAKRILKGLSNYYSTYHGINYEDSALDAAVDLSVRYMHDKFLPDKAIDIIDSAGARQKIKPIAERVETIGVKQITEEISRLAKVPVTVDEAEEEQNLENLEPSLKTVVFGQDDAINKLVDSVLISRSGLRDSNKTLGAFLFSGPTGVGKTEVAKRLASILKIDFLKFDMSEFQEKHSVAKFIGSPPGYVGYSDGQAGSGVLINALEKHPHCVILCDEIEKAHPDIVNIFLQVMDNGMISSQNGKTASARNAFLIFTSNLGAAQMEKPAMGFGNDERQDEDKEEIKKWFAPEFRNRLDSVVIFNKLSKDNMQQVLDKFISELNQQAAAKNVTIVFDNHARNFLIDQGFDRNMGARPLARVITDHIKKPLSREILFGQLKKGGSIFFTAKKNKIEYYTVSRNVEQLETDNISKITNTVESMIT